VAAPAPPCVRRLKPARSTAPLSPSCRLAPTHTSSLRPPPPLPLPSDAFPPQGAADPFKDLDPSRDRGKVSAALRPFIPPSGYDIYVLGVQEGVSDRVFDAVAAHTGAFRLPLHYRLYPAKEMSKAETGREGRVRSRRLGRAILVSQLVEEMEGSAGGGGGASGALARHSPSLGPMPVGGAGTTPGSIPAGAAGVSGDLEPVGSSADMLDRVWGRGDGALLSPKFTGMAVFVSRAIARHTRLLGVYKHSFGASEGSKGGVGVALGVYDVSLAFVNVHMASKKSEVRRAQYCELVDRLGA